MENLILENNLKYIERYDKVLASKIRSISELKNDISLTETLEFEPNIVFNGLSVHSHDGAEAEAKKITASVSNDSLLSIHVIFGLGLGYLFREMVKILKGAIILYEPSLEILRATLEIVDFTPELSKNNVFVTNKIEDLEKKYDILFSYQSHTTFEFLNFYKFVFEKEMNEVLNKLGRLQSVYSQNSAHRREVESKFLLYSFYEMHRTLKLPVLKELQNVFKGVPALIVAAGASLDKNLETIKKYRDRAIVFGVATSAKTLVDKGIAPDFLSVLETFDETKVLSCVDTDKTALIVEPYTHQNVIKMPFKYKFMTCSKEVDANAFWASLKGVDKEDYESKGTVSYNALFAAKILGCNPIILVGQDLAYVDGRCYSQSSVYKDLLCEKNEATSQYEIKLDNYERYKEALYGGSKYNDEQKNKLVAHKLAKLQGQLIELDAQDGGKIPSSSTFALFVEYFKSFAQNYGAEIDLYNASLGGANIEGFKNASLEAILGNLQSLSIDIPAVLDVSVSQEIFDFALATKKVEAEIAVIKNAISQIEHALPYFYSLTKEIKSRNVLTDKLLTNLKKALGAYVSLSEVVAPSSICYRISTYNSKVAVEYALKITGEANDIKAVEKVAQALKEFYEDDLAMLKYVRWRLAWLVEYFRNEIAIAEG